MEKFVRLSVIVPGYRNSESNWHRCIRSILQNIGPHDELICIDDGSPNKPDYLRAYVNEDPRIRVYLESENRGLSCARNRGLELSSGKFVAFVDSDDELLPETYSKCLCALERDKSDIVIFGVKSLWVAERLWKINVPSDDEFVSTEAEKISGLYRNSLLNYAWNKVYRHDYLVSNQIQFDPRGMPCEDIIFNLRCMMGGGRVTCVRHVGIIYYRTHQSLLSCYKSTYRAGVELCNKAWRSCKAHAPDGELILGHIGEASEEDILQGEWDNLWRLRTPKSLRERFDFLRKNKSVLRGRSAYAFFVRQLIYSTLRKFFYVGPVQRWHIKRQYPGVQTF